MCTRSWAKTHYFAVRDQLRGTAETIGNGCWCFGEGCWLSGLLHLALCMWSSLHWFRDISSSSSVFLEISDRDLFKAFFIFWFVGLISPFIYLNTLHSLSICSCNTCFPLCNQCHFFFKCLLPPLIPSRCDVQPWKSLWCFGTGCTSGAPLQPP